MLKKLILMMTDAGKRVEKAAANYRLEQSGPRYAEIYPHIHFTKTKPTCPAVQEALNLKSTPRWML